MADILNKIRKLWSKTNRWHRVLVIFLLVELLPQMRMGFHCKDPALSHTFSGDTISWKWLLGTSAFLPLIVMLIVEKKFHPENISGKSINKIRALNWYKEYLFGLLVNLALVQMLKMLVGAPRPHFFDSCRPEEALTCKEAEYVKIFKCTQTNWMHEANKSFPSGHSSLAVHAGLFLIWYIHTRKPDLSGYRSALVRNLQLFCLIATILCCISRIFDHRHHWWDVLTGAVIGVVILVYTIVRLCKNFECTLSNTKLEKGESNEKINGEPAKTSL